MASTTKDFQTTRSQPPKTRSARTKTSRKAETIQPEFRTRTHSKFQILNSKFLLPTKRPFLFRSGLARLFPAHQIESHDRTSRSDIPASIAFRARVRA